jgi:hypothetical protein
MTILLVGHLEQQRKANFYSEFCSKIISAQSTSTGYLVRVIQEREERDSDNEEEGSTSWR